MLLALERDDPVQRFSLYIAIEMIVVVLIWPIVFVMYLKYLYAKRNK